MMVTRAEQQAVEVKKRVTKDNEEVESIKTWKINGNKGKENL